MAELKKLEPGKTLIKIERYGVREKDGSAVSEPQEFMLFYGNVAAVNGSEKTFHIDEGQYYRYLDAFLESPEGKRYEKPTEEQIRDAIISCIKPPSFPPVTDQMPPIVEEDSPEIEEHPLFENNSEGLPETNEEESEENSDSEKEEEQYEIKKAAEKRKKRKGFPLFKKKRKTDAEQLKSEPESESEEEEPEDKNSTVIIQEPKEDEEVVPELYVDQVPDTDQSERIRKLSTENKKLKITGVILVAMALMPFMFYALGVISIGARETGAVKVISISKDIKAGEVIALDELTESTISKEQFESDSAGTAVDPSGNAVRDYLQLWSNRNFIVGKYATGDLKEGDYLHASDYAILKNGINMIELDIDGTKVKVPVSDSAAGTSDVRLYAIVTSKDTDKQITSFAVNLGELSFNGKTIKSVLDSNGKPILQNLIGN